MSHFAYFMAGGIHPPNTIEPHTWFTYVEQNFVKAINGDDGGTWAPAAVITIGGAGLNVTSHIACTSITATGDAVFQGTNFAVLGSVSTFSIQAGLTAFAGTSVTVGNTTGWTFNSSPVFANGFTVSGGTSVINGWLTVSGATTLESNAIVEGTLTVDLGTSLLGGLTVVGASSYSGIAAFASSLSVGGNLSVSGTSAFSSPATFGSTVSCTRISPSAGITKRPTTISAPTANAQYSANDFFLLRPGSSAQTITIVDGADGDVLEFSTYGDAGTHLASILTPLGAGLINLGYTTGQIVSCRIIRIGGSYTVWDYSKF